MFWPIGQISVWRLCQESKVLSIFYNACDRGEQTLALTKSGSIWSGWIKYRTHQADKIGSTININTCRY